VQKTYKRAEMSSEPRAVTYIGLEENTFALNIKNETFAWCVIPKDLQKQLLRSDAQVNLKRMVVKEGNTFAWCVVPRESQKQLSSDAKIITTRICQTWLSA